MNAKLKRAIEKAKREAEKAAQEWIDNTKKKGVDATVRDTLDRQLNTLIMGLVGFRRCWNGWEPDGSRINTLLSGFVEQAGKQAAKQWILNQAGNLPPLPKATVKRLRAYYLECLEYQLRQLLEEQAEETAKRVVLDVALEIEGDDDATT